MNIYILHILCILPAAHPMFSESASKYKSIAQKIGVCPSPKSIFGTCIQDRNLNSNCLSDAACPNVQKCCREGCNYKVCKLPIQAQILFENYDWPDFGLNKLDWSWWNRSKNFMQGIYDKFWESAA